MALDLPIPGEANWDIKLNAALEDLDSRVSLNETISNATKTASATGTTGELAYDSSYVYICVATNTWIRVAKAAW